MASKEINVKTRLVHLANAVRQKFDRFRHGEHDYEMRMERKFKPLINSQKDAQLNSKSNNLFAKEEEDNNGLLADSISSSEDTIFGLKPMKDNTFTLGGYPVEISNNKIHVLNEECDITHGLISLLTKRVPQNYTDRDISNYKRLLTITRAHLRKSDNQIKSWRGPKTKFIKNIFQDDEGGGGGEISERASNFLDSLQSRRFFKNLNTDGNIISKLLTTRGAKRNLFSTSPPSSPIRPLPATSVENPTTENATAATSNSDEIGRGLQMKFIKDSDRINSSHIYWDDPNELVERLYLLHASKKAGNDNVQNEIISIVTELRQAQYIY